jgi:hypothetical protein
MAITATNTGGGSSNIKPLEPGTYIARCYSMVHIGTNTEEILGKEKTLNKVRISWELPTELEVFKEENGQQPRVISEEYTLSMHEKSTLRPMLEAWRGKAFTEAEARAFDVSNLLGVPCMLTITHKTSKSSGKVFAKVAGASKLMKGVECPAQINETFLLDYDNFDMEKANSLPDFIQEKIFSSVEFNALMGEAEVEKRAIDTEPAIDEDGLPF